MTMLPPKMVEQFAERARNGEADLQLQDAIHIFYQGNNEICLVSIKHGAAQGFLRKQSPAEVKNRKFGKL